MTNYFKLNNSVFTLFLLFFISYTSFAQPEVELAEAQKKHPDDFMLYTQRKKNIDISVKNGKLYIVSDVNNELFILKNLAVLNTEESVDYSDFYKLLSIEAYTLVPEKNKYSRVDVKEYKDRHVFDDMIFHNDVKEKVFSYPQVQIGSKKVLKYKQEFTQPQLLDGFFFASGLYTDVAELTITVDASVDLGFKLFNCDNFNIDFKKEELKNRIVYTWKSKEIEKLETEDNVYSVRYYIPHILYHIKSVNVNGTNENYLSNVDDLHKYYTRFLKDLELDNNPSLKHIADSLIVGAESEEEKIKRIYYWVKDNIRYIAFEDGFGGFIPRQAADVCEKRYGDCKDMANLLVAMIRSVGITNVYHTWIGSNALPYKYEDIPSTSVDNHMIATYIKGDEYIFLDATSKYTPYGYPTGFIQNKEAMVHLGTGNYKIVKVPEVQPDKNVMFVKAALNIHTDTLSGSSEIIAKGYTRDYMLEMLSDYSGDKRMKAIKPYLELGNNKFILKDFSEKNTNNRDKDYIVNYTFDINNYVVSLNDKRFVNLFLDHYMEKEKIDTSRKNSIYYSFADEQKYEFTLEIPDGYEVSYLPKNSTIDNEFIGFYSNFTRKENTITLTYSFTIKKTIIPKDKFDVWNQSIKELQKIYSENISLRKK